MLQTKLVKDLMVPIEEYPTIHMNASIHDAIKILKKTFKKEDKNVVSGHKTIVVHDDDKIVGFLTFRSLLKAIEMEAKKNKLSNLAARTVFFNRNKTELTGDIPVKNIMRKRDLAYVFEMEPITKAVHVILNRRVNSLLVIEEPWPTQLTMGEYPIENCKVLGIIRTMDIFDIIGDVLELDEKIISFSNYATIDDGQRKKLLNARKQWLLKKG